MTRITFQFCLSRGQSKQNPEPNLSSERVSDVSVTSDEMTTIHISDSARIESDPVNNIRYSLTLDDPYDIDFESIYESAVDAIGEVYGINKLKNACLLLIDDDAVSFYLEKKDDIGEFAQNKFNGSDLRYTELSSHTIKISFNSNSEVLFC